MYCIISPSTDPYFNLASEEYLLKSFSKDLFLLYRNVPSIVVGKHQNTLAEFNLDYVRKKGIIVARRISGGGTVFHDLGNLNFAFITRGEEGSLVDYPRYTRPVIEAMAGMGLEVTLGSRNELLLGKKKISGTASHVYKKRAMHHGTLLFSSVMEDLASALKAESSGFIDKAVKSVPAKVTNIRDHLPEPMEVEEFRDRILQHVLRTFGEASEYDFSKTDLDSIQDLRTQKYSTWEWNFGYSPRYRFSRALTFHHGRITLHMNVERGVIEEVRVEGVFQGTSDIRQLENRLTGIIHDPETLRSRLDGWNVSDYIGGLENEELLSAMF